MADMDWVICANSGCNARVLRRIAVGSIGNRLYCARNCAVSAASAVPFTRTIRGFHGDEMGGFVKTNSLVLGANLRYRSGRKAGSGH
jgi:hypothetical protein